mgnify:CR=1 FL=1|jgi:pimeloyl-ACP methyl ester carboxylesterase
MIEEEIGTGNFTCRIIHFEREGFPVIFLHGYMFTSEVWREIGVLDVLEGRKIPFIAIDMPYGMKSSCRPKSKDAEDSVSIVKEVVADSKPVIVGASLGGYIALRYATENPVKGLLLISPVRSLEEELLKGYDKLRGRVKIIYGQNDKIVPMEEMNRLSSILKAELIVYEDSGHPAYLDQPLRFTEDLLQFYDSL